MNKTVLITGGAGFLGSHLVDALLARDYRVIAYDNLAMGKLDNVAHQQDNPYFSFVQGDVRDIETLRAACQDAAVIVHFAAFKIPRYGNTLETLMINELGMRNVLDIARDSGAKVVLASTSDVYGKNPNLPFNEESDLVIGPSTVRRWSYAVSKIHDEHLCLAYREAYNIPVTILRFFGSYGPRQHLSWWGGPQAVFIDAILTDKEIEIHGDGSQTRTFTFATDTVNGVVRAIESEAANGEIFNLGTTHEISIRDLAFLINKLVDTGREFKYRFVPYATFGKYEDVMRRVPDIRKAQRVLGYEPQVSLEQGLLETIRWQRALTQGS